jgi:hypothetical protein
VSGVDVAALKDLLDVLSAQQLANAGVGSPPSYGSAPSQCSIKDLLKNIEPVPTKTLDSPAVACPVTPCPPVSSVAPTASAITPVIPDPPPYDVTSASINAPVAPIVPDEVEPHHPIASMLTAYERDCQEIDDAISNDISDQISNDIADEISNQNSNDIADGISNDIADEITNQSSNAISDATQHTGTTTVFLSLALSRSLSFFLALSFSLSLSFSLYLYIHVFG